jgi:50S ribosomal protein L16 3-hydroxylase
MREAMSMNDAALTRWLGCHLTEPKAELLEHLPLPEPLTDDEARDLLHRPGRLERHGAARLAWMRLDDGLGLYVNGREHRLPPGAEPLVRTLCGEWTLEAPLLRRLALGVGGAEALLLELCKAGVLLELPQ